MDAIVVSYSLTGNNEALAARVVETLGADHVRITESKRRTMFTIVLDVLFKRTPKVSVPVADVGVYDLVIFVGPVWMGQVASPFRTCFEQFSSELGAYAFLSVCGGADGSNIEIAGDLTQRLGKAPACLVELHLANLLPPDPAPTRKDTMAYRINADEADRLAEVAVAKLRETLDI
jgi:multimeric flavodoxin WrbA